MESITEQTDDGITLRISGKVTIANAGEFKQIMVREATPGSSITIDLTRVSECDLSLFQLLCSSHKQLLKTSGTMKLGECSSEVYDTMRSAGILRNSGCAENKNDNCLWHEPGQR